MSPRRGTGSAPRPRGRGSGATAGDAVTAPPAFPMAVLAALREARHVAVLTGAGISAESGIPTFRDALTGLWANYDAEALATPGAFARHPQVVWDWYASRRAAIRTAEP